MYAIIKFIRNDQYYIESYKTIGGNKKPTIIYSTKIKDAKTFTDKTAAQFAAQGLQMATGKIFHIEKLPAEPMGKSILLNGSLVALLIIFLASCSPKITMLKVTKVNGQWFKVEGKRGTFIAPKDSIIHVGQYVPVKH